MVQVTNALVDARIASESAPLTRVTDVDTEFPSVSYTNTLRIEFTTADANTVFLSYDELAINEIWGRAIKVADKLDGTITDINTAVDAANALIAAVSNPPTAAEYREIVNALRVPGLNPIKGV